jgi:hypothetical protein
MSIHRLPEFNLIQILVATWKPRAPKESPPKPDVYLKPDLTELKTAYDSRAQLQLADVKPTGLLIRAKG